MILKNKWISIKKQKNKKKIFKKKTTKKKKFLNYLYQIKLCLFKILMFTKLKILEMLRIYKVIYMIYCILKKIPI